MTNMLIYFWRHELRLLAGRADMGPRELCEYLGEPVKDKPAFWTKMPKKRETFIGLGMALKQPLEVINGWIARYGNKKKLYVKDIISDLEWIYLINANYEDKDSDINYFQEYDKCRDKIDELYAEIWMDNVAKYVSTVDLDEMITEIDYDGEFKGLADFIVENQGALNTAYAKPRLLLAKYVNEILRVLNKHDDQAYCLNTLREYLDDSMINYLTGNPEDINVIDRKTRQKTCGRKLIPSSKITHISLCIALGMDCDDIDEYLEMMGYSPIIKTDALGSQYIEYLSEYNEKHPIIRLFKDVKIYERVDEELSLEEEYEAVMKMLKMRSQFSRRYHNGILE